MTSFSQKKGVWKLELFEDENFEAKKLSYTYIHISTHTHTHPSFLHSPTLQLD